MVDETQSAIQVWESFCENLKKAGSVLVREETPNDDMNQAEGLRKLVRMLGMGFDITHEYGDPLHPKLYQFVTETTAAEGETGDARYYQAVIDGQYTYRVTGDFGDAKFIELNVYTGKPGLHSSAGNQISALIEHELTANDQGEYEIVLSAEKQAGNWLKLTPDAKLFFVRVYAHNWVGAREPRLVIVREGNEGLVRPPITVAQIANALERTADYVSRAPLIWAGVVDNQRKAKPNCFITPPVDDQGDQAPEMPTGHRFSGGHFQLKAHEALVVTFCPDAIPYWGLDVTNYWLEPISYTDYRSHVNNQTVTYDTDGRVEIIMSSQNPNRENWIDLRGHSDGVMLFRWSRTNKSVPNIETKCVDVADLLACLKPTTP